MTGEVLDLAAARARHEQRIAIRRSLPRDPDDALTDAARVLRDVEERAANLQRDARQALEWLREVHDYLTITSRDESEAR